LYVTLPGCNLALDKKLAPSGFQGECMKVRSKLKVGLLVLTNSWLAAGSFGQTKLPVVPIGVTATPGNGEVTLRWAAASGATSYHLKRSTSNAGNYTQIAAPTFAGYTDVGVKNGTTYYYVVSAVDAAGESGNSAQASAGPSSLLLAPAGLSATDGNGQVSLRWSPVTGATSYHLKRATASGGPYVQIAAPWWNGYTDAGVTNGTAYFYVVSAVGANGEGANSAAVTVTPTAPATVTSVTVSPGTASSITSGTLPFTATVQGTNSNKAVVWNAALGTITSSGLYTAPSKTGTDTVTATSAADPTKSDSTSVEITAAPASSPSLPLSFFGQSISEIQASHFPTVPLGGVRLWDTNTTWAQIETSSGTYSWTELDAWLGAVSSHGKDSMYTFGRVPHWASMRPTEACPYAPASGGCAAPPADVDSGDNTWKTFVTALVRHSLSSPELHIAYYEMWNEPDLKRNWSGTMATYQISNKPIWFTEGNWNADGLGTLTDAQKAAYLAQEYMLMWSTDAVARYYWYSWDSKVGTLWVPATGLTPAGTAYNELAAWLIDSTHSANPCSTASDGTWTCALKLSTGYPAEIIWNPDVSKTIPVGAAFATLRTLTSGTVQSIAGHQVAIGSLPVLIIGSQTAP